MPFSLQPEPHWTERKITKSEERLLQMFDTPNLLDGYRADSPNDMLKSLLMTTLIRTLDKGLNRDKATYLLRLIKAEQLNLIDSRTGNLSSKERRFLTAMQSVAPNCNNQTVNEAEALIQHIVDSDIAPLNNHQFENKPLDQLQSEIKALEEAYHLKSSRMIKVGLEPDIEVVYGYDGLYVVDLKTSGSSIEGEACGHCGNGIGSSTDRLLSVRSRTKTGDGTECWTPHVTIVLEGASELGRTHIAGYAGEIKGYGNQKPAQRYIDFIHKFMLEEDYILGLVGGGYEHLNNLRMSDFSQEQIDQLIQLKPDMVSPIEIAMIDGEVSERSVSHMNRLLRNSEYLTTTEQNNIIVNQASDIAGLASDWNLHSLQEYAEKAIAGNFVDTDEFYFNQHVTKLMTGFKSAHPEQYEALCQVLADEMSCEVELDISTNLMLLGWEEGPKQQAFDTVVSRHLEPEVKKHTLDSLNKALAVLKEEVGRSFIFKNGGLDQPVEVSVDAIQYLNHMWDDIVEADGGLSASRPLEDYAAGAQFRTFNAAMLESANGHAELPIESSEYKIGVAVYDALEMDIDGISVDMTEAVDELSVALVDMGIAGPENDDFDSKLSLAVSEQSEEIAIEPPAPPSGRGLGLK